ncbi:MAG: hypothetical protein WCI27_10975 [Candidatus Omnitrophota bacterium]
MMVIVLMMIGFFSLYLELGLRLRGIVPFQSIRISGDMVVVEFDPVLGWRNKVGVYTQWPKNWDDGKELKMTIWPGGLRATAPARVKKDRQIILLGCSFIQGWALRDEDTMAWKLQERFPEVEFLNYGTCGYGTYQSLLLLEEYLKDCPRPPAVVVYGLCDFHRDRNVAHLDFLRIVARCGQGLDRAQLPYCFIDKQGVLKRHSPVGYPVFWGDKYSVALDYVHYNFLKLFNRERARDMDVVTRKLLIEIDMLCKRKGSRFAVCLLRNNVLDANFNVVRTSIPGVDKQFFREHDIDLIDCGLPEKQSFRLIVKGEIHPSAMVNTYWAERVADYLKTRYFAL